MEALVVYESQFGNTRQVADAICRGWGPGARAGAFALPLSIQGPLLEGKLEQAEHRGTQLAGLTAG